MSMRRRHTGRVKIAFDKIEAMAAAAIAENALARASSETNWTLTKYSALYRRRDGSFTLCLIWHGTEGNTLTHTIRGLRLEAA